MSSGSARPPPRITKGSILDILSSPPSSPIPSSPAPVPLLPLNSRKIKIKLAPPSPHHTEPGHSHRHRRRRSRSPALEIVSSSRINHGQAVPESSAAGTARAFKRANNNCTGVLDLITDNEDDDDHDDDDSSVLVIADNKVVQAPLDPQSWNM